MKITIESTSKIIQWSMGGASWPAARVWEGQTESGIPVVCLVMRIAAKKENDLSEFETELIETRPPSADVDDAFPSRLLL